MEKKLVVKKLFESYKKYASFVMEEDKNISPEQIIKEEKDPATREKERVFLLLLQKHLKKYSFEF